MKKLNFNTDSELLWYWRLNNGRDKFSSMRLDRLVQLIQDADRVKVEHAFSDDPTEQAVAIRWFLRGLDVETAIRLARILKKNSESFREKNREKKQEKPLKYVPLGESDYEEMRSFLNRPRSKGSGNHDVVTNKWTLKDNGSIGQTILNAKGEIAIWTTNHELACRVVRLLSEETR